MKCPVNLRGICHKVFTGNHLVSKCRAPDINHQIIWSNLELLF